MASIYSYKETMRDDLPMFYTGTEMRPDLITLFVKEGREWEDITFHVMVPSANMIGLLPVVGVVTGAIRIFYAVKTLFQELQQVSLEENNPHRAACWIAFKNLLVGIVELIPFSPLGWITLVLYHTIQGCIYVKRCSDAIEVEENVFGVAIDGEVVFTQELAMLDAYLPQDDDLLDKHKARIDMLCAICERSIRAASALPADQSMATTLDFKARMEQHARGMQQVH